MILILLTVFLNIVLISSTPLGSAQSGTNISTVISSDTTWTQANSPYNIKGNVLINNGASLTLATGTTLNLNGYIVVTGSLIIQQGVTINIQNASSYIQVDGILQALGTNSSPININGTGKVYAIGSFYGGISYSAITFSQQSTGWNQQTSSGSIIENTIFSFTTFTLSSSVKLSHDSFANNLSIKDGSPVVTGCIIKSGLGIFGGSPVISNNQVTGGITLEGPSSGFPTGQVTYIDDNSVSGQVLYLEDPINSAVMMERNALNNNNDSAIEIAFSTNVGCSMTISNNTITNSAVGIQLNYGYPQLISNNNIYNNVVNFKLDNDHSFNCTDNWWGTTDQQTIGNSIYDFKDDFTLGKVNFVPFLTAPNPEAMPNPDASITTLNPSATPTPSLKPSVTPAVPEFPSWLAILPLFISVLLVAVYLKHRRTNHE
jgi:hypothetical protein